jgi:hypothetical protein
LSGNASPKSKEERMANREQGKSREKKKPKADKNKQPKHQPFGGKTPFGQMPQVGQQKK